MDVSPWVLYWLFQLDSFISFFKALTIMSVAWACVMLGWGAILRDDNSSDTEGWHHGCKLQSRSALMVFPFVFFMACAYLTPSTKTALMIWTIPAIANNEQVQQLPTKLVDMLNGYLDQYSVEGK